MARTNEWDELLAADTCKNANIFRGCLNMYWYSRPYQTAADIQFCLRIRECNAYLVAKDVSSSNLVSLDIQSRPRPYYIDVIFNKKDFFDYLKKNNMTYDDNTERLQMAGLLNVKPRN